MEAPRLSHIPSLVNVRVLRVGVVEFLAHGVNHRLIRIAEIVRVADVRVLLVLVPPDRSKTLKWILFRSVRPLEDKSHSSETGRGEHYLTHKMKFDSQRLDETGLRFLRQVELKRASYYVKRVDSIAVARICLAFHGIANRLTPAKAEPASVAVVNHVIQAEAVVPYPEFPVSLRGGVPGVLPAEMRSGLKSKNVDMHFHGSFPFRV